VVKASDRMPISDRDFPSFGFCRTCFCRPKFFVHG
jgi:hypothetical protein